MRTLHSCGHLTNHSQFQRHSSYEDPGNWRKFDIKLSGLSSHSVRVTWPYPSTIQFNDKSMNDNFSDGLNSSYVDELVLIYLFYQPAPKDIQNIVNDRRVYDKNSYMECPKSAGDREDQSNSNGNGEIQLGSTGNQRNPSDPSWTTKAKYGRDAAILRFANLFAFNKSVIGGTIFPHKRKHKATWISPDHTTKNQIDHICINKKFRRTMEDVRTKRGADIASDHHLVVANLKLKLKKNWKTGQTALQRFNTAFLRDTNKINEFKITLNNRKIKKTAINNSRTRAQKVQAQAEYIEANKQVKKSITADNKKYVEELTTTAEKVAREGNLKQLYDTTKKLAGKYSKPERPVTDKEDRPITEIQKRLNSWVEYFEELPNRPAPTNPPDIEAAHIDLPIDVTPPTTKEIRMAIRQIKSGKAVGPDNIPAEALKSDIE
ncbi:unnamed protein product, partial [Schistosoma curassoni]|uniref:Endo/exonuclease/phosphatase domain-containing protein n=1 Tax=Schistosoma curassoni TaxID=6186 RepID=A0A183L2A9_9TREM